MQQRWPEVLWLVRHGESTGNVAWAAAMAARRRQIGVETRDPDVPLSPLGERQAEAVGRWFAEGAERPQVTLVSPHVRTRRTAELIRGAGGFAAEIDLFCVDERLRERELGHLGGLTSYGIEASYPAVAGNRALVGKFYYRPPGGESWCDVILRLRGALDTVSLHYGGQRVLLVCHQVIILCMRYILENMGEEEVLAIDKAGEVKNCSLTTYRFDPSVGRDGALKLDSYNSVLPVESAGEAVTAEPQVQAR